MEIQYVGLKLRETHRNVGMSIRNDKTSDNIDTKVVLLKREMCMIKFVIFDYIIICTNKNNEV